MSYNIFASYYDILTRNVNYKGYAKRIQSLISEFYGDSNDILIAELACGTASLGLELEKLGFSVVGTDISEEMLSSAQQKIRQTGSNIAVFKQDMRKLCLFERADVVVCSLDALNHLPRLDSVRRTFLAAADNLKPGGLFIFDMNTPFKHHKVLGNNTFIYNQPEIYTVWQNEYRAEDCSVKISLDFFVACSDGSYKKFSEIFRERAYHTKTVTKLLSACGFKTLGLYDELKNCAPNKHTERILYAARRI